MSSLRRWGLDGTWQRPLTDGQADADADGDLDWLAHAVDSTVVRAHQHAAGLRPGKDPDGASPPTTVSAGHATAGPPKSTSRQGHAAD